MRVHDVVHGGLVARKTGREAREGLHPGQQLLLGHVVGGAGRHVHDADVVAPAHQLLLADGVAAGEHVHQVARQRQFARQVGHVDVLAAAIDAARRRQRRRVVADEGDAPYRPGGRRAGRWRRFVVEFHVASC
jgi:hypothetical protein